MSAINPVLFPVIVIKVFFEINSGDCKSREKQQQHPWSAVIGGFDTYDSHFVTFLGFAFGGLTKRL
jgi:hypothetical protein